MQDDKSYHALTTLCIEYLAKIEAAKNKLVDAFAKAESQQKECVSLRIEISQGRIDLPKSVQNILQQAQEEDCHYRLIINQVVPAAEPIWGTPILPILVTTEDCQTTHDVLKKSRALTKQFREDLLKEIPEYPHIRKMFQYWDQQTGERYQTLLNKKITLLWPTLLNYIMYPRDPKAMQNIREHIDSLEALFHVQNSFGKRIQLNIPDLPIVDRIRAVSPKLGENFSHCFERVNSHKKVHHEIQTIRDHLCLTR